MVAVDNDDVPTFLQKLVEKIAKDNGFADFETVYKSIDTGGANYTGNLYTVDVTQDGKTLALFAKISNTTEQTREHMDAHDLYEREVFAYTELAEAFKELEDERDVPEEKRFAFAKMYGSDLTDLQEVVVLENLSARGYETNDRCESMTWPYARQAIENLARFHALSHALRLDHPDKFDRLVRSKNERLIRGKETKNGQEYTRAIFEICLMTAQPEYAPALQNFMASFKEFFLEQYAPTEHSVLAHGDYRISNLMVKYREGAPSQLLALDYQLVYHGNGLNDLFYLLYTGTDCEFRKRHERECFRLYRSALVDALARLGHELDVVYPQELFDQHVEEKMLYGLALAMFVLPFVLVKPGEHTELNTMFSDDFSSPVAVSELFVERFRGILQDMVDGGYLKV